MKIIRNNISELNQNFGGSISGFNAERVAHLNDPDLEGMIFQSELVSGISYYLYDLQVIGELVLKTQIENDFGLCFVYPLEGNIECGWTSGNGTLKSVKEFSPAIFGSYQEARSFYIKLQPCERVRFALIGIDGEIGDRTSPSKELGFIDQLYEEFFEGLDTSQFAFLGSCNLRIREQFEQLYKIRNTGVIRKLLVEGILHFAIALIMKQYEEDLAPKDLQSQTLTRRELVRINEYIEKIKKSPQLPYNLDKLGIEIGLNAAKIQDGFKTLTGMTANNFIREQRLEMAEMMMKEGESNISEIVYSVGLASRSYFSKIFKAKYGCCPKTYYNNCRLQAASA